MRVDAMRASWRTLLLAVLTVVSVGAGAAESVAVTQPLVIDVRTPEEFAENHLINAKNIDVKSANFSEQVAKLDKNLSYRLYCHSGKRAAQAAELMQQLGFKDVKSVGGLQDAAKTLHQACVDQAACELSQ